MTSNSIGAELIELRIRGPTEGLVKTSTSWRPIHRTGRRAGPRLGRKLRRFLQTELDKRQPSSSRRSSYHRVQEPQRRKTARALHGQRDAPRGDARNFEEKRIELATADASFEDLRKRVSTLNPVVGRLEEQIVQTTSELAALRTRYTDEHSEVQAAERKLARLEEERSAVLASTSKENGADMQRLWNLAAGVATSGDKATRRSWSNR